MISNRDIQILTHLRTNARKSLVDISKETEIPISTIFDKLKTHEGDIIKKFTAILNFPKLGYHIRKKLIIKTNDRGKLVEFLLNHKNINSVFKVNNGYDFVADCIFKEMQEWYDFKSQLEKHNIEDSKILDITTELRREDFLNRCHHAKDNG